MILQMARGLFFLTKHYTIFVQITSQLVMILFVLEIWPRCKSSSVSILLQCSCDVSMFFANRCQNVEWSLGKCGDV